MNTIFIQGDSQQLKTKWYLAFQRMESLDEFVIGIVNGGIVVWPRGLGQGRRSKQLALNYANQNSLYGDASTDPKEWLSIVHGVNTTFDEITKELSSIEESSPRAHAYINDDSSTTSNDKDTLDKWISRSRKEEE